MGKVYVGDVGTKFKFDIGVDVTNVTSCKIYYKKPSGSTGYWAATTEAPTYVVYTISDGDLDESGVWEFQPYVELASGWKGRGEKVVLEIHERVE